MILMAIKCILMAFLNFCGHVMFLGFWGQAVPKDYNFGIKRPLPEKFYPTHKSYRVTSSVTIIMWKSEHESWIQRPCTEDNETKCSLRLSGAVPNLILSTWHSDIWSTL